MDTTRTGSRTRSRLHPSGSETENIQPYLDVITGRPMQNREAIRARIVHKGRVIGYTERGRIARIYGTASFEETERYGWKQIASEPGQNIAVEIDLKMFMDRATPDEQEYLYLQMRDNTTLAACFPIEIRRNNPTSKGIRRPGNA